MDALRGEFLKEWPDDPEFFYFRSLLFVDDTAIRKSPYGVVLWSVRMELGGVVGSPPRELVLEMANALPKDSFIVSRAIDSGVAAPALADWFRHEATLFARPEWLPLPPIGPEVRRIERREEAGDLPEDMAKSYLPTMQDGLLFGRFVEGRAVGFACCPLKTETLADIGVYTLELWRGRGYAGEAATALIAELQSRGLRPNWGCTDANQPSIRAGLKLGFLPACKMVGFEKTSEG